MDSTREQGGAEPEPRQTAAPVRYQELAPQPPAGRIDLGALVPGEGPLELDVGFGRGMSLFERARAAPGSRLLGIEAKSKWVYKVDARTRREGLERVRVVCGDARDILHRAAPDGCLARAFIHFPDPWWKKRHAKRRMIGRGLLDDLARLLAPGGELFIQTDVQPRAESYLELLREHEGFAVEGDGFIDENPFGARSNRERRVEQDGLPVWRLLARNLNRAL